MSRIRYYVGPAWPPSKGAYDYALTLSPSDLAWEFLRRAPAYQRDYRLNRKGMASAQRRTHSGPKVTRIWRLPKRASSWGLRFFVDPALPAPSSPVCWCHSKAAPVLEALAERPRLSAPPDLRINELSSAAHIILGPAGDQLVLLKDANSAVTLRLHGSRATLGPVAVVFMLRGLPDPGYVAGVLGSLANLVSCPSRDAHQGRDPLMMRDALVALDGRCAGASYRDVAAVLYGSERTYAEWSGLSRWMKERVRRALARGEQLRDGGYLELLGRQNV